ncbi:MAG: glycosyltransferase family 39 protein [Bdellovibrionales bacterium]|nr:glycosyltransferase family 39 protein [Bdellovibrionales bacterium]
MSDRKNQTFDVGTFVFLALIILVAALYRFDFLVASQFVVDADEAIVGLMAKHILEGAALPVFYYGQHYMGSLEAILASWSFALFGVSGLALKLVPLACSLILIIVFYEFLLVATSKQVARVGAVLMAVPAPTLVIWSAKARGGFIEILLLGTIAFLWYFRWLHSKPKNWNYFYGTAFILGVGWWVNNQIIYFMLPVGLFSILFWVLRFSWSTAGHMMMAWVAFFIGGSPYWIYNLNNKFVSFQMFHAAEEGGFFEHLAGFFETALPILLGAKRYWQTQDVIPYASVFVFGLYGLLCAGIIILVFRSMTGLTLRALVGVDSTVSGKRLRLIQCIVFVALYALGVVAVFSASSFGYLVAAPRYLLPLYVGLFALAAIVIGGLNLPLRSFGLCALLLVHLACAYSGQRAIPGEPFIYKGERAAKSHDALISWLAKHNITWIRTNYWIGYRLAFETSEKVRFAVFQNPYQIRIPAYQSVARSLDYDRLPLVLTPHQSEVVRIALEAQGFVFRESAVGGYVVLYGIEPSVQLVQPLDIDVRNLSVSSGDELKANLIDRDDTTRWGTGMPQKPNMFIELTFPQPQAIRGLTLDLGHWTHDFPRGLRIETHGAFGAKILISEDQYQAIRYLREDEPSFTIYRNLDQVAGLKIIQTGNDEIFDWSLAELEVF